MWTWRGAGEFSTNALRLSVQLVLLLSVVVSAARKEHRWSSIRPASVLYSDEDQASPGVPSGSPYFPLPLFSLSPLLLSLLPASSLLSLLPFPSSLSPLSFLFPLLSAPRS